MSFHVGIHVLRRANRNVVVPVHSDLPDGDSSLRDRSIPDGQAGSTERSTGTGRKLGNPRRKSSPQDRETPSQLNGDDTPGNVGGSVA